MMVLTVRHWISGFTDMRVLVGYKLNSDIDWIMIKGEFVVLKQAAPDFSYFFLGLGGSAGTC